MEDVADVGAEGHELVAGGGDAGDDQVDAFGVEVSVIEAAGRLLAVEEPEASAAVAKAFAAEGVTVRTSARAERVEHDGDGFRISLADGVIAAERLLVAAGRRDITGKGAFTHMSMYQADVVIRDLTGAGGPWA
ncbi:FAD-dependent oxidoreductase, partial [Streptosporangium sp. NPDC051023]|uniref:FAD-dependent oxidoreductase n=1 Tax=Streptosporangium sp. NPDC051023 TaxID=3155410 RepID=UPI00344DB27D